MEKISPKVKADVGFLSKVGRKTLKNLREMESMQNIANGKEVTILEFTPKKK